MLQLVVDGVYFRAQVHGGITRIFREILPRMCDLDPSLDVTLLAPKRPGQLLPTHERIRTKRFPTVERYLRPSRLWRPAIPAIENGLRAIWAGPGEGRIWHSTYYTFPLGWRGRQVVTVPDMIQELLPDLFHGPANDAFRRRKRECVRRADAVICISNTTRRDLVSVYGLTAEIVHVIPLACSDIFRRREVTEEERRDLPVQPPFLLYVGTRAHYKNFDGLLQAYSIWRSRCDVPLAVVSRDWLPQEERQLRDLGIQDNVRLLTGVDDSRLCALYNTAAGLVYPSLYEGFGIPLLEAMACGCPIVASRIPSTTEIAEDYPVYFEPGERDSLLAALETVLARGQSAEHRQAGYERVRRFSWDTTARQTLEVYRALCDSE